MSKAKVAVLKVVSHQLSVAAAAAEYGYSRQQLYKLLARYKTGGLDALEPRSRRPHTNPQAVNGEVRDFVLATRRRLTRDGWDAGPISLAAELDKAGLPVPSTSTIRRILHTAGLITPEPRKRPRSSYLRFEAAQPNECWQSDFTHWRLADGSDVEILNWLDDHSRYLLGCTVHAPVTGAIVVDAFVQVSNDHGLPASTLTDNGRVYTARHGGGCNAFEYLLAAMRITQKNGRPHHPQTQGKVERFHQTLKKWLTRQPPATTITELQTQLDTFRTTYNEHRTHRALNRKTPGQTYRATPKATPTGAPQDHFRLRYDHIDNTGKVSIRRAGKMHHLGIGTAHHGKEILAIADAHEITVIELRTSEILSTHDINPNRSYWRNKQRNPGRWPRPPVA